MNLGEFINLRNKVLVAFNNSTSQKISEETLDKYGTGIFISYVFHNELKIDDKTAEYTITSKMPDYICKYQKYTALNSISNIFSDSNISPFEYINLEKYFRSFEPCNERKVYYEYQKDETSFINEKLKILEKYLGKDYEVPDEFYESINRYSQPGKLTYEDFKKESRCDEIYDCFTFSDKLCQKIKEENSKLNYNIIESQRQERAAEGKEYPPMLLARFMSDEELSEFEENGIVSKSLYEGTKIWDAKNVGKGDKNYYTFIVMNNRKNALLNLSSIVSYFKHSRLYSKNPEEIKTKKLVFFTSYNDVSEDDIVSEKYWGLQPEDEWDMPDIYGQDGSKEVAVPYYYSKENYTLEASCTVNYDNIEREFIRLCNELHILDKDNVEMSESAIYQDFLQYIDEERKYRHNFVPSIDAFNEYYRDRMRLKDHNKYFYNDLGIRERDIYADLSCCIEKLKTKFNLDDYTAITTEANVLQQLTNWHYYCPGGHDLDSDYDDYSEDDESITQEEVATTVKNAPLLDRESAKQQLTDLIEKEPISDDEKQKDVAPKSNDTI